MEITVLREHQVLLLLVELFLLLLFARALGELSRRFGQPAVVGEIAGGVLLGPTVFGTLLPGLHGTVFPAGNAIQMHMLEVFSWLGALFLLMVAGMEVDLSVVRKQGRSAIVITVVRFLVSFALGFGLGMAMPESLYPAGIHRAIFASFLGIASAVCAVPVLVKILMDLGMLKSDIGLLSLSSSTLSDFVCWIFFTMIVGVVTGAGLQFDQAMIRVLSAVIFLALALTVGRVVVNRVIRHIHEDPAWQSGSVMVFAFLLALGLAIISQWIHVHAMFGFFLAGILIGDCPYVSSRVRESISAFVMSLFSPLFFASIGLKLNFFTSFNPLLVLAILVVILVGNIAGVVWGGRLSGLSVRDSVPVAAGMLAGGAMEIILALIAWQSGLIGEPVFLALVIVAVITSTISGPLMSWSIRAREVIDLGSLLPGQAILADVRATDVRQAVSALVERLGPHIKPYTAAEVVEAVMARESIGSTALGEQMAVPHARLEKLTRPVLAAARIQSGLVMDSPDGQDVHLVFLILTPATDLGLQVQILSGIIDAVHEPSLRNQMINAPDDEMRELLVRLLQRKKLRSNQGGALTI